MPVHVMLHYNMQNAFLFKIPPNAQEKFFLLLPILGISPAIGTLDIAQSHRGQQTQDDDDHGDEDAKKEKEVCRQRNLLLFPPPFFACFHSPPSLSKGSGMDRRVGRGIQKKRGGGSLPD